MSTEQLKQELLDFISKESITFSREERGENDDSALVYAQIGADVRQMDKNTIAKNLQDMLSNFRITSDIVHRGAEPEVHIREGENILKALGINYSAPNAGTAYTTTRWGAGPGF